MKVLLVDDDPVVTQLYRDRLSAHGFQVNTAGGGHAALSVLRSANPDLVVLDLIMPQVSGVEVLKYIRSEPRLADTSVVLLTSDYDNELGHWAARVGVDKALLKAQCSPSMLMAVIDELLEPHKRAASSPAEGSATAPPDATAKTRSEGPGVAGDVHNEVCAASERSQHQWLGNLRRRCQHLLLGKG
jgi:DNA-binding response OmpR family regulator